jgi:hypothetical protein
MEVLPVIPKRFKFARRVNWIFLAASILSPTYVYYCAEVANQGNFSEKYFTYHLISLVGILFWGGTLWLSDEIKLKIVMVSISIMIGLYLMEIFLNSIAPTLGHTNIDKLRNEKAKIAGVEYDTRTEYQVLQDLKSSGVNAVPAVSPPDTNATPSSESLLPLAGVSNKTTVLCNESGKYAIFQSDRYGFNNPDAEWDSPQTEWVLTGDSFTQGSCVQLGEDIAGQLRLITGKNVLNLGIRGNGPLSEIGVLKEYAAFRKPKKVAWIYFEANDMFDLTREISVPLLVNYLRSGFSQNLIHRQVEIDSYINKYIINPYIEAKGGHSLAGRESSSVAKTVIRQTRLLRLPNIRQRMGSEVSVNPLFIKILKQARDQTAAWGGELYFVYLPEFTRYSTIVLNHDWHRKRSEILKIVRSLNLPVIDIHQEIFLNHTDPLSLFSLRMSAHYNAEGYAGVAKAIVSEVTGEQKSRKTIDEGD